MRPLATLEEELDAFAALGDSRVAAQRLLGIAEEVLEHWLSGRGAVPTEETSEGFRLLALQRQGARGVPSFNACRESCREIAYHFNLLCTEPGHESIGQRQRMMAFVVKHLLLFVRGKLEVERLGEFCCSARPLRLVSAAD